MGVVMSPVETPVGAPEADLRRLAGRTFGAARNLAQQAAVGEQESKTSMGVTSLSSRAPAWWSIWHRAARAVLAAPVI
jgi:hypothetical protein